MSQKYQRLQKCFNLYGSSLSFISKSFKQYSGRFFFKNAYISLQTIVNDIQAREKDFSPLENTSIQHFETCNLLLEGYFGFPGTGSGFIFRIRIYGPLTEARSNPDTQQWLLQRTDYISASQSLFSGTRRTESGKKVGLPWQHRPGDHRR